MGPISASSLVLPETPPGAPVPPPPPQAQPRPLPAAFLGMAAVGSQNVFVPSNMVGRVLGKKGATITSIQQQAQLSHVSQPNREAINSDGTQTFVFSGTPEVRGFGLGLCFVSCGIVVWVLPKNLHEHQRRQQFLLQLVNECAMLVMMWQLKWCRHCRLRSIK